jgi:uncharacterized repeat protein (TIGR01451 family)
MGRMRQPRRRDTAGAASVAAALAMGLALALPGAMLTPAPAAGSTRILVVRGAAPAADPTTLAMTSSVSPSPLVVGATAVYTVTVRNTGAGAATSVTSTISLAPDGAVSIESPLPAGCTSSAQTVTCTEATIPAGGSVTYDIPVTLAPSLSDGTNISLQGLVSAADAPSTNTQLVVPAFTKADVAIDKTGPTAVAPDGTITYTITVTNHGPSNAQSVTWHDPTDGNLTTITSYPCGNTGLTVTCNLGTLAPGETRTFTLTVKVNSGVPDGAVISNCATVYTGSPDTDPGNNQSCTETTVGGGSAPGPNVGIVKTAPPTVEVGGTIDYSVVITNRGPGAATNVVVHDPIHVPFDSISALPGECSLSGITVTCTAATLEVGQSRTFDFAVTISAGVPAGTHVMNCASVTSDTVHVAANSHLACEQTEVVAVPMAGVEIAKTGPAKAKPGETYSYTLTVTNDGPDAAADVVVTDPIDTSAVTVISVSGACQVAGGTVTCDAGTLARDETKTFTVTVMVKDDAAPGAVVHNCGTVVSSTVNPDIPGTSSCVDTYIDPPVPVAQVEVAKSGPATVSAGDTFTYSLSATNLGPDIATDVLVTDPLDTALVTATSLPSECTDNAGTVTCDAGTLAVGETKTFTITVKAADGLAPGTEIADCGHATSSSTLLDPVPQPDCIETVIVPPATADVSVVKTGPATVSPGGIIDYTLIATDHGPDAAANVVISDPLNPALVTVTSLSAGCTEVSSTVTCRAGTLADDATRTFTITVRVNVGITRLVIPNCTEAYTDTRDPVLSNNLSCMATTVDLPDPVTSVIEVPKHGPAEAHADGTASYTIDVINHGPDDATGVVVTDPVDLSLVSVVSLPDDCVLGGGTVTCLAGDLAVGQTESFTVTVMVAADAAPGTEITNCASATSDIDHLVQVPNSACTETVVLPPPAARLVITKTAPRQASPGGTIGYPLSVTNFGPDAADNVVVKDPIPTPSLVTVTSLPSGCAIAGATVTCALGTLAAGATRRLTIEVRVNDVASHTVIGNCAAVYSTTDDLDHDLDDTQSCVNTIVIVRKPFVPVTG